MATLLTLGKAHLDLGSDRGLGRIDADTGRGRSAGGSTGARLSAGNGEEAGDDEGSETHLDWY